MDFSFIILTSNDFDARNNPQYINTTMDNDFAIQKYLLIINGTYC